MSGRQDHTRMGLLHSPRAACFPGRTGLGPTPPVRPSDYLEALRTEIGKANALTAVMVGLDLPLVFLRVSAGPLTEHVTCDVVGEKHWFLYSWGEQIAPVSQLAGAARSIARILGSQ